MSDKYKDVVIGLEVHIQLTKLKTKLFCSCSNDYEGKAPNTYVCPICIGLPGSLPVVNEIAIEFATRLALALGCKINDSMYFFRKNYFYPDMSKNFQISQYNKAGGKAFGDGGKITIKIDGKTKDLQLDRIHLEEDPARLVHQGSIKSSPYTLVDYNRSGVALIEIVSDPVMSSPEEAREYLNQLKSIVSYTGIADLNLEGSCRVDANISIKGHPRSEVKNINSFKEVESALKWEILRQKDHIKSGKEVIQETRHWDGKLTITLRTKEFEKDYRYFPEQDLVPIEIENDYIEKIKAKLPEMPYVKTQRLQNQYNLSEFDADNLVLDKDIADFFEEGVNLDNSFTNREYKLFCNWVMNDISAWLNENNKSIKTTMLNPKQIVDLINSIKEGKITGKIAKTFVDDMMFGTNVKEIIKRKGKIRISNETKLQYFVDDVFEENIKIVHNYLKNPKALQALIGCVMGKTEGQADPELTRELILKNLFKYYKGSKYPNITKPKIYIWNISPNYIKANLEARKLPIRRQKPSYIERLRLLDKKDIFLIRRTYGSGEKQTGVYGIYYCTKFPGEIKEHPFGFRSGDIHISPLISKFKPIFNEDFSIRIIDQPENNESSKVSGLKNTDLKGYVSNKFKDMSIMKNYIRAIAEEKKEDCDIKKDYIDNDGYEISINVYEFLMDIVDFI